MLTNKERVARVEAMLMIAGYETDDPESAVTDALADLMHYCDAEELDFAVCDRSARMHFECELDIDNTWEYDSTEEVTPVTNNDQNETAGTPLSEDEINNRLVKGEQWIGKTIKEVIDDNDELVIFLFADGTFGIVDPDPEGCECGGARCGVSYSYITDVEEIKRISRLLDTNSPHDGTIAS